MLDQSLTFPKVTSLTHDRDLDPEEIARSMRSVAVEKRYRMSADGRIGADNAAALLLVSPATLKQWRYVGTGPRYTRIPLGDCRVSYFLIDLARWLVASRSRSDEWR